MTGHWQVGITIRFPKTILNIADNTTNIPMVIFIKITLQKRHVGTPAKNY